MAIYNRPEDLLSAKGAIQTIDMHTGGEPLRVIMSGYPEVKGATILEKRNYAKSHLDQYRTLLMYEPRGHNDMYGLVKVDPERPDSDFGVLFMHNEGYSTMCGHATIAICRLAVEFGWVEAKQGLNEMKIDAPCGQICAYALIEKNEVVKTWFKGVPSFVVALDEEVEISSGEKIIYDLAYGGAFYAYVDAVKLGLDLVPGNYRKLIDLGMEIKKAVNNQKNNVIHPYESDLSFLYGTIFIGSPISTGIDSRNVCIFAEGELDRSPTGSGVSGRMAIHSLRNELLEGEFMTIESIMGTVFECQYSHTDDFGSYKAVIPEVHGNAYYTGANNFIMENKDPLKNGFLLREYD